MTLSSSLEPLISVNKSVNIYIIECTKGEVQLVDGWNQYEGRVEVCDEGMWKTVCDREWREEEAMVVCRQLNYSEPSST